MSEEEQTFFVEFCVSLFSIYDFKRKLVVTYCQYIDNIVSPIKRKRRKSIFLSLIKNILQIV